MERERADTNGQPPIINIAYTINDKDDLDTLVTIYGPPPIQDYANNIIGYRAVYNLYDRSILGVLDGKSGPDVKEVWYLLISTKSDLKNDLYVDNARQVYGSDGKPMEWVFDCSKYSSITDIHKFCKHISFDVLNEYKAK